LALGSTYRRLGAPGEEDFIGAGVHFCATCDGPFYRGRDVLVIGGGNSACEEGLFLTKFASKVTIITRGDLTASRIIQAKVRAHPKMEVIAGHTVAEFCGDKRLESVVIRDAGTGATRSLTPGGVFVFIGLSPNTSLAKGTVDLDQWGFIVAPMMETSQSGIFAAGDCRQGSTKQAASAAGEGAAAALMIRRYVEPLASGIPQQEPVAAGSM